MSQKDIESEIEEITQIYIKFENDKKVDKMLEYYAPDIISHMPFSPELRGFDAIKKQTIEYMTETGFYTFTTTKIDVSSDGELAYITGVYHYTTSDWKADSFYDESEKGEEIVDDGKMMIVWKKINDEWTIVFMSGSSNLPPK